MDFILLNEYCQYSFKKDEKSVLIKNNIVDINDKLNLFEFIYNFIFKLDLSFKNKINLLKQEYYFFNLDSICDFDIIEDYSYKFYNVLNNDDLNFYKDIIDQAKKSKDIYLEKTFLYACLISMKTNNCLHKNLFFSQDLIDLLFDERLNIDDKTEEYKKYQVLKEYFIFISTKGGDHCGISNS